MEQGGNNKTIICDRDDLNYETLVGEVIKRFDVGFDFVFTYTDSSKVVGIINNQKSYFELCQDLN
jgi:hypothetical protein